MITGRHEVVDGADHLVLRRGVEAPVEEVWAAFTESDRLGLWFATWAGDPASGQVEVTWAFEEDMPTEPYVIEECDPPHHLRVRNVHEDPTQVWTIDVALTAEDFALADITLYAEATDGIQCYAPGSELVMRFVADSDGEDGRMSCPTAMIRSPSRVRICANAAPIRSARSTSMVSPTCTESCRTGETSPSSSRWRSVCSAGSR